MNKILVTGASGFIGSNLCKTLSEYGRSTRGSVRNLNLISANTNIEYVSTGNINLNTNWKNILIDVDCIIHCAARVHVMKETKADLIKNSTTGSFDIKVPSTLLSDFNHDGHTHTASPDSTTPYIVVMKLQWTVDEEIKSIRFLFVMRYQPQ